MPRLMTDMLEEEGPEDEDVIPPGLLGGEEDAESPYAALLKPAAPVPAPAAKPAAGGATTPRRTAPRLSPGELEDAQAADKDEQRKADFESGLDTMAFRRPVAARQVGSPNAGALMQRLGLERQGRQDERQAGMDEQARRLSEARIAKLGQAKKPGRYATLEGVLGLSSGALEGSDPAEVKEISAAIRSGNTAKAAALAKEAERKWQEGEHAKDRASRERAAALGAGAKAEAANRGSSVPGLEKDEGAEPTAEDAKKVKATLDAANRLRPMVEQLRQLHGRVGTELYGDDAQTMEQMMTGIQLEAKTIAELGALSGPDLALMKKLAGADPTSLWNNVKGVFGKDNTQNALGQLDKWVGAQVDAKKKTYGYHDAPSRVPVKPGLDLDAPAKPMPKRTDPATGETRVWNGSAWVKE